jgi:hypothetical protein
MGLRSFGATDLNSRLKRGNATNRFDQRGASNGLASDAILGGAIKPGKGQQGAAPLALIHPESKDKGQERKLNLETEQLAAAEFRRQLLEELSQEKKEQAKTSVRETQKQADKPLTARKYAHQPGPQTIAGPAPVAPPLLYWHPVLILPEDGISVDVFLGKPDTPYRIDIQAHSLDGRLGAYRQVVPGKVPTK